MTDTEPKPKRRLWRWPVVSLILLVLFVASWWFWPRGDSRFVGRWKSQHSMQGFWDFRSNGVAVWNSGAPSFMSAYTTWQVKDNVLRLGEPQISPNQKWRTWVIHQWNNSLPFNKWIAASTSFRVLEVRPDALLLVSGDFPEEDGLPSPSDTETLTRLPE